MIQELPPQACFDLREADPQIPIIDVRTPDEFAKGRPEGSVNIPVGTPGGPHGLMLDPSFVDHVEKLGLDLEQRMILTCAAGARSLVACHLLQNAGYQHLINLSGGFLGARKDGRLEQPGWRDQGLPEER